MRTFLPATIILFAVAGSVAVHRQSTAKRRAWQRMLLNEGTDLTLNDDADVFMHRITAPENQDKFFVPWRLLRLNSRIIVLEANLVPPFPRPCMIRSHVFDEEGRYLTFQTFRAGSGHFDDDARVVMRLEVPVLEIRSGGRRVSRYYALTHDLLSLSRIEDGSATQ